MADSWYTRVVEAIATSRGFRIDVPVRDLPTEHLDYLLRAPKGERVASATGRTAASAPTTATFEGLLPNLQRRYKDTESEWVKGELEKFMVERPCPTCGGRRLKPEALSVTVDDRTIADVAGCR